MTLDVSDQVIELVDSHSQLDKKMRFCLWWILNV